jgi:acetolactate synthase-1/2/3 large subunit/5-guanidino-2-oxopentanoate decarboxylase
MTKSGITPNAVVAHNPDFCALAKAYGAAATSPNSLEEFAQALKTALGESGPTLIHVRPEIIL